MDYVSGTITDSKGKTTTVDVGHVVQDSGGEEHIVVSIRLHFTQTTVENLHKNEEAYREGNLNVGRSEATIFVLRIVLLVVLPPGTISKHTATYRFVLVTLKIMEQGSGRNKKAALSPNLEEENIGSFCAMGECTGSDPTHSEARLLRDMMEENELGNVMYPNVSDPA